MWIISAFLFYLFIVHVKSGLDFLQHPVKSCHIGDKVENECNTCLCSAKTVFECSAKVCDNSTIPKSQVENQQNCLPSQLYVKNLITCICTKDGKWPHKSCHEVFQALPPSAVDKFECVPDTYVTIDCNVCRCGTDGDVILSRCTKNICESEQNRRAMQPYNANVYSTCDVKNWYSLAPCQFCYCVNQNKLMCNTGNDYSKNLELGTYNLRVCGKNLITEAIELIPENDNSLRLGITNTNATLTPSLLLGSPDTKFVPSKQDHNIDIELNREGNENRSVPNKAYAQTNQGNPQQVNAAQAAQDSSDKEYYSDEFEDGQVQVQGQLQVQGQPQGKVNVPKQIIKPKDATVRFKPEAFNMFSPWKPEQGREDPLNESEEEDEDPYELIGQGVERPAPPIARLLTAMNPEQKSSRQFKNDLSPGNSDVSVEGNPQRLKINLPAVLNKVFQLALRKSMVSLTSETKCEVGTTSVGKCKNMCFCLKNGKLLCTNNQCNERRK